jgi:hypothetical protein
MSNGRGPAAFQHLREDKQYLTSQVKCKLWGNCLQAMEAMEQKPRLACNLLQSQGA